MYAGRVISVFESKKVFGSWDALVWCFDSNKPVQVFTGEKVDVDYSPEVLSLYKQYQSAQLKALRYEKRVADVLARRSVRRRLFLYSKMYSVDAFKLLRYFKEGRLTVKTVDKILNLFDTRVKNPFKIGLRKQIIEWLNDPDPAFKVPLSYKQMEKIYEM